MKLALWFVIFSAAVCAVWLVGGGAWDARFTFEGSVRWLESTGPWAWAAGILLLVSDLLLPVPATVVISALGYVYGVFLGGLISSAGLALAGITGYVAGRLLGETSARRWLGDRDYEKGRLLFEKRGGWIVALSRALPILPEVISCTAGLMRMPFRRFVTALLCGCLPMGFLFAAIGEKAHDAPGWATALSLLLPALLWLAAGRVKRINP